MKRISLLLLALLVVTTCSLSIQCTKGDSNAPEPPVTPQPDPEPEIPHTPGYPAGVIVEAFSDTLADGKVAHGWQVIADFKANKRLRFAPQFGMGSTKALKPTAYFSRYKSDGGPTPYVVINGGFFGGTTSMGLLISGGQMLCPAWHDDYLWDKEPYQHYFPVRAAFGQYATRVFEATWVYSVEDDNLWPYAFPSALQNDEKTRTFMENPPTSQTFGARKWTVTEAIGAGPMLVYRGSNVAEENYWREVFHYFGIGGLTRQPRTAIGATSKGVLVMVVCDGRGKGGSVGMTLPELADKMLSLGCANAINLDGGGSSTIVGRDGTVLNLPSDSTVSGTEVTLKERNIPTAVILAEE